MVHIRANQIFNLGIPQPETHFARMNLAPLTRISPTYLLLFAVGRIVDWMQFYQVIRIETNNLDFFKIWLFLRKFKML